MTINCKGQLIDLSVPKVMGILNVTPDSFFDGGSYSNQKAVLDQVEKMLTEGATFIDVGACSSKPNAALVTQSEELQRIVAVVQWIQKYFPEVILSIDTYRASVAATCLDHGAAMINDIGAGHLDDGMLEVVAKYQVPYVMMHLRGTPQTMQQHTNYQDIVKEMVLYFAERIHKARSLGISDLIVDPGFGFAKNLDQNYEVLQKMELFQTLEVPILVGFSRKSMIQKVLGVTAQEALNGTTVLNTLALTKGACILRVHDVKAATECIKLYHQLNK
ncbi:dihydropteroate synthase [Flavobacterium crassostreae]|uniref:Dihydropteroate synthase n=1 Tax=Flavobacterium crassostreae TaxID=1763534 RepID=A0A1B9E9M3_9FLAO|nr:dihydropteroate synthase [Flavobacterium crassostreae]OCB78633.1 dihydropteroate synthase [Flavobacterium crassostreae]